MAAERIPEKPTELSQAILTAKKILTVTTGREVSLREASDILLQGLLDPNLVKGRESQLKEERVQFMNAPQKPLLLRLYNRIKNL